MNVVHPVEGAVDDRRAVALDDDLVLVKGTGVARPRYMDESPSAFGGTIEVKLPDRE